MFKRFLRIQCILTVGVCQFGDTQKYFEGYPPTIGERFVLWYNKLGGGIVIDTSPVLKIEEGKIHTMYSVYEIEKV